MSGADLFILCLALYGAGIFSAIAAMLIGRSIGRRQSEHDHYWDFDHHRPETITEICHRLRVPPPSKL